MFEETQPASFLENQSKKGGVKAITLENLVGKGMANIEDTDLGQPSRSEGQCRMDRR